MIAQWMVNERLAPSSIEARGVVAHYEPGRETLNIWSSTQNPHILHTFLAQTLGLGQDRVRAIPGHRPAGGGRLRRQDQHLRRESTPFAKKRPQGRTMSSTADGPTRSAGP